MFLAIHSLLDGALLIYEYSMGKNQILNLPTDAGDTIAVNPYVAFK